MNIRMMALHEVIAPVLRMACADETADVGIDLGTPVVEAIGAEEKSRFTGRIPKVTVEVK